MLLGVVLVKEDDTLPMSWSMGRVVRVQTGDDGVIRVATILVKGKEVSRAVRKLCPLSFEGIAHTKIFFVI